MAGASIPTATCSRSSCFLNTASKCTASVIDSDPKRKKFYFSYCNQEGHAPWYCEVLSKRESWQEYPAVKWFKTKKGTQLYCPVGNVSVDYSDQHVYSRCTADMPGHENVRCRGDQMHAFLSPDAALIETDHCLLLLSRCGR